MYSRFASAFAPAPASADTIATEAEVTTKLLDNAVIHMRNIRTIDVSKHLDELANTRQLIQKIRYQQDLQTRPVATALATLKIVIKKLERVLVVSPKAVHELVNTMDELHQAGQNLKQSLPGDISSALNNEVKGGFQANAAMGGDRPEGRLLTEAIGNKSTDASQINAPVYGNPAFLEKLILASNQARA